MLNCLTVHITRQFILVICSDGLNHNSQHEDGAEPVTYDQLSGASVHEKQFLFRCLELIGPQAASADIL